MLDMLSISIFRVQEWIRMLFAQCAKKKKIATAVSLEGTIPFQQCTHNNYSSYI